MPALSRARWPYTNTQWIEAADVCNYSEAFFDYALLMGGEDQVFEVAAMVGKIVWAPQPPYSPCNFQGHGHLDTVHGLGHVDKPRNDVYKVFYELCELWHGHCTAHADGVSIAYRSSVPGGCLGVTA